jgi:Tfp pilus assembly protein PilV
MVDSQVHAAVIQPVRRKNKKVSAIEIIIAVVVMSALLAALLALYRSGGVRMPGASAHSTAAEFSDRMADRIRQEKNPAAAFETGLGHACNTAQSIADVENDIACWQDEVSRELPNGSARIVLDDSTVPAYYVITISWTDSRSGTATYVQRVAVQNPKANGA